MSRVATGRKRGHLCQNDTTVDWFLAPRTPATACEAPLPFSRTALLKLNVHPAHGDLVEVTVTFRRYGEEKMLWTRECVKLYKARRPSWDHILSSRSLDPNPEYQLEHSHD